MRKKGHNCYLLHMWLHYRIEVVHIAQKWTERCTHPLCILSLLTEYQEIWSWKNVTYCSVMMQQDEKSTFITLNRTSTSFSWPVQYQLMIRRTLVIIVVALNIITVDYTTTAHILSTLTFPWIAGCLNEFRNWEHWHHFRGQVLNFNLENYSYDSNWPRKCPSNHR